MDVCLRVLKESNKSRFDSYSVRNSVLIISHLTFWDCRVHKVVQDMGVRGVCAHQHTNIRCQFFKPFCFTQLATFPGKITKSNSWKGGQSVKSRIWQNVLVPHVLYYCTFFSDTLSRNSCMRKMKDVTHPLHHLLPTRVENDCPYTLRNKSDQLYFI